MDGRESVEYVIFFFLCHDLNYYLVFSWLVLFCMNEASAVFSFQLVYPSSLIMSVTLFSSYLPFSRLSS
jgi:hypothetical protein